MSTVVHQITLEQFMARPDREDDQREELILGELVLSPSAKFWHSAIVRRFRLRLAALESPSHGFVITNDFACVLGKLSMPAPDLAAVSIERANQAEDSDGWLEGSPELVVEVASPSNRNLQRKAELYLAHGAEQVWIVYRNTKTVTVMSRSETTVVGMGEILEFHGVGMTVASIMSR